MLKINSNESKDNVMNKIKDAYIESITTTGNPVKDIKETIREVVKSLQKKGDLK